MADAAVDPDQRAMNRSLLPRAGVAGLAAALLWVPLAACDDPTGSVPAAAVGTYSLSSVNGLAVPARVTDTPDLKVDILSGTLLVRANGSYRETRESLVTEPDGPRTASFFAEGTLNVSGSSLEVRERLGGTYAGSYAGTTLSYTVPGGATAVTFTYVKD
jgi:hypothetical protein